MADLVKMPDEAGFRRMLAADPLLIEKLRADVERAGLKASVAARFASGDLTARMRSAARGLPGLEHLKPGSSGWTAAAVAHARHLTEHLACCQALFDDDGPALEARGMSRQGAAELLKAMQARFDREEAARQQTRIMATLSSRKPHVGAVP